MERLSLLRDLNVLITSPLSTSVYSDIKIQIDGGRLFSTSKLAVFLLHPYLEGALSSADMLILPPCSFKNEEDSIINLLQFSPYATFSSIEEKICENPQSVDNQNEVDITTSKVDFYPCPECPAKFSNKGALKKHSVTHSDESYECHVCRKRIKHRKNLIRHLSLHGDKQILFKCKFCDKSFNRKAHYNRHISSVHSFVVF